MAYTIPSDAHIVGDPTGHTTDHNNVADVLSLAWPPYLFNPIVYGAKGDGKLVNDGAITSGTNALVCATSAPFAAGDVGKPILVVGAGAAGITTHSTTISGFTDSAHVALTVNAGASISSAQVLWSTDDTAAVQAAINAAVTYAQLHGGYGEVLVQPPPGRFYGIAGALVTGGATLGNAQLTLPIIAASGGTAPKVTLRIRGAGGASAFEMWTQNTTQLAGSVLLSYGVFASSGAQGTSVSANGNPVILGGPTQPNLYGAGGQPPNSFPWFSNMCVHLDGIRFVTPFSGSGWNYGCFDFSGVGQAKCTDVGLGVTTTYLNTWAAGGFSNLVNGLSVGGLFPAAGNNDECLLNDVTVAGGYRRALILTEHCDSFNLRITYCYTALAVAGSYFGSVGASHAFNIGRASIEACVNLMEVLGIGQAGIGPIVGIGQLDTETSTPTFIDDGSGGLAAALGMITLTGLFTVSGISIGATFMQLINWQQPPGPVTTPAGMTINTAFKNVFWRWATITLNGGTGITSVQLGNSMGGASAPSLTSVFTQTAGALTTVTVRLPPGGWIKVNGTTLPTMYWQLD